jgi:hypothetical protein
MKMGSTSSSQNKLSIVVTGPNTSHNIKVDKIDKKVDSSWLNVNLGQPSSILSPTNKNRVRTCESHLETYEEYKQNTQLMAQNADIKWMTNIFEGKTEIDKVILNNSDFVLVPDKDHKDQDIDNLHILALFKLKGLMSIRDLTADHIELLTNVYKLSIKTICEKYDINESDLFAYFHYYPSTWQLHIHFCNMSRVRSQSSVSHAHNVIYVIQNLMIKGNYYQEVVLQVKKYL